MSQSKPHIIDVSSVAPENVARFLDYLSVSLSNYKTLGSSGEDSADGGFAETYRCLLSLPDGRETPTTWTISVGANGVLRPIEVEVEDQADKWTHIVEQLVRGTLVDMVNGRGGRFFQRHLFAYLGHPLDGEYYVSGFRIAPSQPTNPYPFGFGEQVMILDIEAEGISESHARSLGKNQAIRISSLLSLFLDVGLYAIPSMESRWFYDGSGCKPAQLGYRTSLQKPIAMPSKGRECKQGSFYEVNRSTLEDHFRINSSLRCPRDIRVLCRTFNLLSPIEKRMFEGAASLFQIAMVAGKQYPTVHIAYCVAAVDSLTKHHKAREFVELVCRLNPELQPADVSTFYENYRSAHFHAGALPGGETESMDMTTLMLIRKRDQLSKQMVPRLVHMHMRTVILRWLLDRKVADPSISDSRSKL